MKERVVLHRQFRFSVLAGLSCRADPAPGHPGQELVAVADAQDRNPQLQYSGIIMGRGGIVDAVGASGEDDALITLRPDLRRSDAAVRLDLREDVKVSHPPGDELVILPAEIQHQDLFHAARPLLPFRVRGRLAALGQEGR